MIILVLAFIVSLIPSFGIFFWLRNREEDPVYRENCKQAIKKGALSVFPVLLCSMVLAIIGAVLRYLFLKGYAYDVYYKFMVLAFAEELVKFLTLRKLLQKTQYSWLHVVIYMVLIGIGFEVVEAVPYAIGSQVGHMVVRGVTIMHGAFGFVMGYFYGKYLQNKKKVYAVLGFLLPWLMHGTYDFTLTEEIMALTEWIAIIPLALAVFSVVLIIWFIIFVKKVGKNPVYTDIIGGETVQS